MCNDAFDPYEILRQSWSPTAIVDTNFCYVMVSESWTEHYGVSESEALGKYIFDLFPNIESGWKDVLKECLKGKKVNKEDTTVVRGNKYRMQRKIMPWRNKNNEIAGLVIILDEIIYTNKLEEELRQSNDRFKSAFELSATGMAIVSPDGRYLEVNEKISDILGYTEDELLHVSFRQITHPDDLPLQEQKLQDLITGKIDSFNLEKRYFHKNGKIVWVYMAVSVLKDVKNNPIHIVSQIIDRTDAQVAIEQLRKSREALQKIMDETPDIICNLTFEGQFLQVNKAAKYILGYEPEELIGKYVTEIILPEDMEEALMAADMVKSGTNLRNIENRCLKKDGTVIPLISSMRLNAEDSTIFGIIQDASEKKLADQKFKQLNIQLEKRAEELAISNQYLEEFAFVASHDLQEPLRMISSFLELLHKKYDHLLDDTARKYIQFAVDGSNRMQKMILGLLEYSTIGKTKKKFETVDLNFILKEAIDLNKYNISKKNAVVNCTGLPIIQGIKTILLQLFHNLISNALKYQAAGSAPVINVSYKENQHDWIFLVADNGIGIDSKYKEKIFALFQRLHTKNEYSGSGIGLAICKRIVENHSGKIWLESKLGSGTNFYFSIKKQLSD